MRVVIVGAGVAGLSAAHALLARGVRPVVVAPDHGMTSRGAGIVSAQFREPELRELARRSRTIVRSLVPADVCGHAQIATTRAGARTLEGLADVEERLPPRLARALDPEFRRAIVRAVFDPEDLRCDPARLLAALRRGAAWRKGRVRAIRDGAVLTGRGSIEADRILVAAGPWTSDLVRGLALAREPARTVRARGTLPAMLHVVESGFYARPDGRGRILAGDGTLPAIRREMRRVLGSSAKCVAGTSGEIVVTRTRVPLVRRMSETTWVLTALGGDGLALGPALGERVAAEILGDVGPLADRPRVSERRDPWRPDEGSGSPKPRASAPGRAASR